MATDLICPDCGGVIGGDETDSRPRCQCQVELALTSDDTEVDAQAVVADVPAAEGAAPAAPPAAPKKLKLCCKCGKDVTNAKRARDTRGYWCWDCHRADLRRERGLEKPRARCPQCGRLVPADSITTYHGNTLCTKCRIEQEELPNHQKLKFKLKVDDTETKKREKLKLYVLLGIVLAVLIGVTVMHLRH
jgi:hypothetical protein